MTLCLNRVARLLLIGSGYLLLPQGAAATTSIAPLLPAVSVAVADPLVLQVLSERVVIQPRFVQPLDAFRVSSPFGPRVHPIRGRAHAHAGADMAAPRGTPVHAVADGTVVAVRDLSTGYGRHIVVQHDAGYSSWYAHLDAIDETVKTGTTLVAGQRLGAVGSTGSATGPHLHLEIRLDDVPMEPLALLQHQAPPARPVMGIAPAWRAHASPP